MRREAGSIARESVFGRSDSKSAFRTNSPASCQWCFGRGCCDSSSNSRLRSKSIACTTLDAISEELWAKESGELQEQLRRVRAEMERHDGASQASETAGLQTLELARSASTSDIGKTRTNKRPMKTVVSNSTFGRESLSPTSIKPFQECANRGKSGEWLGALDDFLAHP